LRAGTTSNRFVDVLFLSRIKNLEIEGIVLYGGTRHSTNKAFERYFQVDGDYLRDIYSAGDISKNSVKKVYHIKDGN